MTDGVTITLSLALKPEAVEGFCANLPEMLKETAGFAGFRDIRVVRHKDRANEVMFIENWDSEDAYAAYIAWRTETGAMAAMAGMVSAAPQLDIWPRLVAAA